MWAISVRRRNGFLWESQIVSLFPVQLANRDAGLQGRMLDQVGFIFSSRITSA